MELSPRKQAVLKAIVKAYIKTGEPVGSKNLTMLLENAPSPATLRNEMSELCELGFLHQPHTSAGRIPTNKGYRIYIDSLMSSSSLNNDSVEFIKSEIGKIRSEPENIPRLVAEAISHFTGLPTVSCLISTKPPRIKKVDLLPIGRYSLMLLVITDDARTRNCVFRQGKDFSSAAEKTFKDLINRRIIGKSVSELNKAYIQTVAAESGIYALELLPLFTATLETIQKIKTIDIGLSGEKYLYNISSEKNVHQIISLINNEETAVSLFKNIGGEIKVVFGADTGYTELLYNNIVAAKFECGEKYSGYIGVIGPNRISYEQIIPLIEHTAENLTKIMTEAQNDMED